MIGYSEREIFSKREKSLLWRAERFVQRAPYKIKGDVVRCHELARAVGALLLLEVCDGWYGMVDHSWLWTKKTNTIDGFFVDGVPNILDVYTIGRLPMVQLVASSPRLPYEYRRGDSRKDVRWETVNSLIKSMKVVT